MTIPTSVSTTGSIFYGQLTQNNVVVAYNTMLLAAPYELTGLSAFNLSVSVASTPNPDGSVNINVAKSNNNAGKKMEYRKMLFNI